MILAVILVYIVVVASIVAWHRTESWREPGRIEMRDYGWYWAIIKNDPVVLISKRWLREAGGPALLRRLGYRPVEAEVEWLGERWVRPMPLWLAHKGGVMLQGFYVYLVSWLFTHHVLYYKGPNGEPFSWRHARPGFGRVRPEVKG